MRIGGIGNVYPTYVYNPNTVSANSMNKLSRISDNVLDKKVDYSETALQENQNPLKKGQTVDFEGMLAKQMQQGRNRAAKIMPKGLGAAEAGEEKQDVKNAASSVKAAEAVNVNSDASGDAAGSASNNVTQMQRAIQAYEMFMTA